MATLKAPARLPELVRAAFAKALHEGDLSYFPTHVQDVRVGSLSLILNGNQFQLRFSPSLANKPKAPRKKQQGTSSSSEPFDPFAYTSSPPPRLFVADVGAAHFLVLNKFAIVPGHFILATRAFAPQTRVLDAEDLHATLACIRAYEDDDGGDGALFATFSETIRLDTPREDLHAAYLRLYGQAVRAAAAAAKGDEMGGAAAAKAGDEAAISYNMAMTRDRLVICPRLAEGGPIRDPDTGEVVGQVSLNGTMLAGTALVKTEAEWDALRRNPQALTVVLKTVGIAQPHFSEESIRL
ncbi:hypothetical protein LLEC1_06947 [Akanthomyces lecanii]|uniref:Uncharacterized protein n=1 Tax=Cordyceps confragosa TaxID=2714763 RepID=A0A179I7N4_CORDF|nr:hypothetical protein LLEC1_06947 [Akanthomyces lecanii]